MHADALGYHAVALSQHQIVTTLGSRIIAGTAKVMAIKDRQQLDNRKRASNERG